MKAKWTKKEMPADKASGSAQNLQIIGVIRALQQKALSKTTSLTDLVSIYIFIILIYEITYDSFSYHGD